MAVGAVNAVAVVEKRLFVPTPTKQSQVYWDNCLQHRLVMQRCTACGRFRHYPRPRCPFCLSKETAWTEVSGRGTVYTFTVIHRAPLRAMPVPYVLAQVELEEGVRMMTHIVGCEPESVRIGLPVEVDFVDLTEEIAVPVFRPAAGA